MILQYAAQSHMGYGRAENQDNLYANGVTTVYPPTTSAFSLSGRAKPPAVFAVCDGMGGEANGAQASHVAVKQLRQEIEGLGNPRQRDSAVLHWVETAHHQLTQTGLRMGTTMALAVSTAMGFACYNVGDSPIYCLTQKRFYKVSHDHNWGNLQRSLGQLSDQEIRHHKSRNKLVRCIGIGQAYQPEAYPLIREPCRILLCSDGLTNMVTEAEIEAILRQTALANQATSQLLQLALQRGGLDNISIIVVDRKSNPIPSAVFRPFHGLKSRGHL